MMKRTFASAAALSLLLAASPALADSAQRTSVGVVKFRQCVEESSMGKQEHEAFEGLRNRMAATLEQKEKALNEIATKFQDADFLDSLPPEKEAELKQKFRMLSQDLSQYQNEYYQQLNQANMRVMQEIGTAIGLASKEVAAKMNLDVIVNEDNCFYFAPGLDVTAEVISVMNRHITESIGS